MPIRRAPSSNRPGLVQGDDSQSRSADSRSLCRTCAVCAAAGTQSANALPPRRRTARRVNPPSTSGIAPCRRLFSSAALPGATVAKPPMDAARQEVVLQREHAQVDQGSELPRKTGECVVPETQRNESLQGAQLIRDRAGERVVLQIQAPQPGQGAQFRRDGSSKPVVAEPQHGKAVQSRQLRGNPPVQSRVRQIQGDHAQPFRGLAGAGGKADGDAPPIADGERVAPVQLGVAGQHVPSVQQRGAVVMQARRCFEEGVDRAGFGREPRCDRDPASAIRQPRRHHPGATRPSSGSAATEGGTGPIRRFPCSPRSVSLDSLPSSGGTEPARRLPSNASMRRSTRLPSSGGMPPASRLRPRRSETSPASCPSFAGMRPVQPHLRQVQRRHAARERSMTTPSQSSTGTSSRQLSDASPARASLTVSRRVQSASRPGSIFLGRQKTGVSRSWSAISWSAGERADTGRCRRGAGNGDCPVLPVPEVPGR